MQKFLLGLKVYGILILFIAGWWLLAFKKGEEHNPSFPKQRALSSIASRSTLDPAITAIDRNILKNALSGDYQLMARLIADWDIDAQILHSRGFEGIKRICHSDFLHSQSLIRTLQNADAVKKSVILSKDQNHFLIDDSGNRINLKQTYQKFLPQTFAAASFLLSLVSPNQIVALPRSLRDQTALFPKSLTDQIPLDIDRYNAEKLFQAKPEIAFVAHYSHPATIQALVNQGVTLYTMKNIQSFPDIFEELIHLGNIANKPLQAELMKIFIDAATIAIDNQQAVLVRHFKQHQVDLPRVLVVNFHQTFTVPSTNTLTGHILTRMPSLDISLKYVLDSNQSHEWMVPIDKERLVNLNPDYLIITTENEEESAKAIFSDKALKEISAIQNNRLIFVDESIQHSPSQFAVLAYHDLIQALVSGL